MERDLQAANMLWNFCKVVNYKIFFVQYQPNCRENFLNHMLPLLLAAKMRPNRLDEELLYEDVDKTIKNSRTVEELIESFPFV